MKYFPVKLIFSLYCLVHIHLLPRLVQSQNVPKCNIKLNSTPSVDKHPFSLMNCSFPWCKAGVRSFFLQKSLNTSDGRQSIMINNHMHSGYKLNPAVASLGVVIRRLSSYSLSKKTLTDQSGDQRKQTSLTNRLQHSSS